jgi:hypothetical protein
VEGDEETLAQWALSQIEETNAHINVKECGNAQVIEIDTKLAGMPFTMKFYLELMTSQEVSVEMEILYTSTLPLT